MANFRSAMSCRIFTVLLITVFWIGLWYNRMLPGSTVSPPPLSGDGGLHRPRSGFFDQGTSIEANLQRATKSSFWDVDDTVQLTDDLIGEVVEELHKVREGITSISSNMSINENIDVSKRKQEQAPGVSGKSRFQAIGQSLHSFVLSSVFRVSIEKFYAVGLVSVQLREMHGDPIHSCAWVPKTSSASVAATLASVNDSSVVWGSMLLRYVNESQATVYDVSVLKCSFEDPVGANGEGGFLVFNVTSPAEKGFEFVPVFRERPDEIASIQFEGPFRYDYAYCSPPVFRNMSSKYVKEWLMYHQGLWDGKIHYFIYDAGGIDSSLQSVFQPLVDHGLLTIVDMQESRLFQSSDRGHQLMINDCLQRTRFLAGWAFFWDFDEYFQIVDTDLLSMPAMLQMHNTAAWISLGNMIWSRTYCSQEEEDRWAVERMCFRLRFPTCGDENRANTCHGVEGQRKWIANPRKVVTGTVHRTLEPEWNGVILDATVARLNHYHELSVQPAENEAKNCWIPKNLDEYDESTVVDGWWWKDVSFSRVARGAHLYSNSLAIFNASWV